MKCSLCQSADTKFLFQSSNKHGRHMIDINDTFSVNRCLNCDCIFLFEILVNDSYYQKYYQTDYYNESSNNRTVINMFLKLLGRYSLDQKQKNVLKYMPHDQKLKILDIGCGDGVFLHELDGEKFEKYGVEIHKKGIELSRKRGLTVYDKGITEIDFGKKRFDVITLLHVLEHLENPISVFKKIHTILRDDGVLLFSTPNTESLGFKFGKKNWFHLDSPRHLILFNNKSAEYLCNETNFTIENSINEYYDYPLDLFWSLTNSAVKYIVYPMYPLAKFFDQEVLTVVCRKK